MPKDGVTYDTRQVAKIEKAVRRLKKQGVKVKVPLKKFAIYHMSQTIKGFVKGRRAGVWRKLAPYTLAMRKHAGVTGKKPLVASGMGKRSIQATVLSWRGSHAASTFTRLKYMKIHQTGGTGRIPARTIRAKNAKALKFQVGGVTVFATVVHQPARTTKIPQRKFLHHTNADIRKAVELLVEHERKVIKKAGFKRRR